MTYTKGSTRKYIGIDPRFIGQVFTITSIKRGIVKFRTTNNKKYKAGIVWIDKFTESFDFLKELFYPCRIIE